ncbi:hypothetical protein LHYA1_G003768 [Lachnellula hyalina]|uniref:Uncharacterized protein n=1 Tax=Lachnellula hyalina TaxID=1316788 RepID=A0A8H8R3A8_9HELO|nr:uncharacterized protein LHYA1_G003768 [Lachnellula hyalina]TVY27752.1 hypothetical protein LHYA1_G003768 [Lachnellula hyalina]
MGKNTKRTKEFIESIPDSKLDGLPSTGGTLYNDTDFRLDMQGMTSKDPKCHNLQVQTLKKAAPQTVATFLVKKDDPPTTADIRSGLIQSISI